MGKPIGFMGQFWPSLKAAQKYAKAISSHHRGGYIYCVAPISEGAEAKFYCAVNLCAGEPLERWYNGEKVR